MKIKSLTRHNNFDLMPHRRDFSIDKDRYGRDAVHDFTKHNHIRVVYSCCSLCNFPNGLYTTWSSVAKSLWIDDVKLDFSSGNIQIGKP